MLYNDDERLFSEWVDNDYAIYNLVQRQAAKQLRLGNAKESANALADFLENRTAINSYPFSNITDDIDYSNVDFSKIAYDILEELE